MNKAEIATLRALRYRYEGLSTSGQSVNGVRNDNTCVRNDDFSKNKNVKNIIFS